MQKAQSSMEYLSTYAWAIILIGVALAIMYSLGLFDLSGLTAKAQPGACQIYRPYGPGTVIQITQQGLCNGIEPKFVAVFSNSNSKIAIPDSGYLNPSDKITISAWVYANSTAATTEDVISKETASSGYLFPEFDGGASSIAFSICTGTPTCSFQSVTANYPSVNKWHFVAATYNGNTMSIYIDGALAASKAASGGLVSNGNSLVIGAANSNWFLGEVSNVQLYNASLSANQIEYLYIKGIGYPPTQLQNLAGWWPLNGDINDYSGNGGTPATSNSITFTSAWGSSYSG